MARENKTQMQYMEERLLDINAITEWNPIFVLIRLLFIG